ncbi:MAG: PAS domain S-box protein [Cyanobacteria bacterium P01_D01_bin.36]
MKRPRALPLRTIILIPFVLQLLATVGFISWIFFRSGRDSVHELAGQLREEVSARVEVRLNSYLSAPQTINEITANALDLDQLTLNDFPAMQRHFLQQSTLFPDVSYVYFGGQDGQYIAVYTNTAGERFYEIANSDGSFINYAVDEQGTRVSQFFTPLKSYDPRAREWYENAENVNGPIWINLYNWTTVDRLGISLTQPYYDAEGQFQGVLGTDLSQDKINAFLQDIKLSPSARVFLIEHTGALVASSTAHPSYIVENGRRARVDAADFTDPLIKETAQYIEQTYDNQLMRTQRVAIGERDSQHNFVQITPLENRYGLDWLLVVVVPESDFISPIRAAEKTAMQLCFLALGLSVLFAIWFAGRLSRPILHLASASEALSNDSRRQLTAQNSGPVFKKSLIQEINVLSTFFKEMSDQLASSYQQLEQYSQSLEVKVAERTHALEQESLERKQSEETLQTLVSNVPGTVYRCLFNDAWTMLFMSESILELTGYPASDFVNDSVRSFSEIVYPSDLEAVADSVKVALSNREPYLIEYRIFNVAGEICWFYGRGRGVFDSNGELLYIDGVLIDITPQKLAEEAVEKSEERYRSLFEDAPIALWEEDFSAVKSHLEHLGVLSQVNDFAAYFNAYPDVIRQCIKRVKMIAVNQAALDLFEAKNKEDILKRLLKPTHLSARDGFQKVLVSLCRGETSFESELMSYSLTGKIKHVICKEFLTPGHQENWSRALVSMVDISDRVEAQSQLTNSEAKYRTLNESTQDAVMLLNDKGFIDCNPATLAMFGYIEKAEFKGVVPAEHSPVRQPNGHRSTHLVRAAYAKATRSGTYNFEWTHKRKDGSLFPAEVWLTAMEIDGETVIQAVVRDITQRKKIEADVLKAKEAAEIASEAKSEFLANMSHELRSPLNAILGFSELMTRSSTLSYEHQDDVEIINRSGEYLLTLINDVLDMSKIEAGRIVLTPVDFDLHRLIEDLHSMFKLKAEEKHLQLLLNRDSEVPQYICADQAKVRQVLINLINNAIKFTQQGQVTLNVGMKPQGEISKDAMEQGATEQGATEKDSVSLEEKLLLYFEVTDTGVGIDPTEAETIFEPFVQSKSGLDSREGTGLGLPISRKFVQLMGGDISMTSRVAIADFDMAESVYSEGVDFEGADSGTTVRFHIRVTAGSKHRVASRRPQRQIVGLMPNQPSYRLLVVDDKPANRRLLVRLLSPLGFELKEAKNGQAAIDIASQWQPHLIWMDLRMPDIDGFEATRLIREQAARLKSANADVMTTGVQPKIVALSATQYQADKVAASEAGCDDFIGKPFHNISIFNALGEHLNVRYRYSNQVVTSLEPSTVAAGNVTIDSSALSALSPELLTVLESATRRLQWAEIFQVIDQIEAEDKGLATALKNTVENFRYDCVLDAIETVSR